MCSNSLSHLFQRSQAAVGALLHGRRRPCCLPWPQVIHGGESQRRQKTWHFATDMSFCSEALLKSLVPRLNIRVYIYNNNDSNNDNDNLPSGKIQHPNILTCSGTFRLKDPILVRHNANA